MRLSQYLLEFDIHYGCVAARMSNAEPSRASLLFIAGDLSGDVHAAALADALLTRAPQRKVHALGGRRLRAVVHRSPGGEFLGDTTNSSAIGLLSSLKVYFHCRGLREQLRQFIRSDHVDLIVLCDWGGFNGRVVRELHAAGIPILYYFPPRSWRRSGPSRFAFVPYVDRVATPFPWSAERLRAAGSRAEWVGHPLIERNTTTAQRETERSKFGVAGNETLIALLPGSRSTEVVVLAPRMAEAAGIVRSSLPNIALRFFAVVPPELVEETRSYLPDNITLVSDRAQELLLAADAAVVKTGTGTLEAVVAGTPQVAIYDVSVATRIEWCLLWAWRWVPFVAMPNIILGREVVPEFIGVRCQPARIANALTGLLTDPNKRQKMLHDYALIRRALGSELDTPPTERTAEIVEEMLNESATGLERAPLTLESAPSK